MLLADNLFERSIHPVVRAFDADPRGAIVLLAQIPDAAHLRHLGVPEFGADGRIPDRREAGGASELLLDRRLLLRHVGLRRHQELDTFRPQFWAFDIDSSAAAGTVPSACFAVFIRVVRVEAVETVWSAGYPRDLRSGPNAAS